MFFALGIIDLNIESSEASTGNSKFQESSDNIESINIKSADNIESINIKFSDIHEDSKTPKRKTIGSILDKQAIIDWIYSNLVPGSGFRGSLFAGAPYSLSGTRSFTHIQSRLRFGPRHGLASHCHDLRLTCLSPNPQ